MFWRERHTALNFVAAGTTYVLGSDSSRVRAADLIHQGARARRWLDGELGLQTLHEQTIQLLCTRVVTEIAIQLQQPPQHDFIERRERGRKASPAHGGVRVAFRRSALGQTARSARCILAIARTLTLEP